MLLEALGELGEHARGRGRGDRRWSRSTGTRTTWSTRSARPWSCASGRLGRRAGRRRHVPHEHRGGRPAAPRWSPPARGSGTCRSATPTGSSPAPATWTGRRCCAALWAIGYDGELASSAGCPAPVDEVLPAVGAPAAAGGLVVTDPRPADRSATTTEPAAPRRGRVLVANWRRALRPCPSRSLYPHQWSWDSAFIAIGLRHWSPAAGGDELVSLFGAQWADGRVPHIVFNPARARRRVLPRPGLLAVRRRRRASAGATRPASSSRPCTRSPPLAVTATSASDGLAFLRRIYPAWSPSNATCADGATVGPAGWPSSCTRGSPGWTTARLGRAARRGAGRPGAVRRPHPPRPRPRRTPRAPHRPGLRALHPAGRRLPRPRLRRPAGCADRGRVRASSTPAFNALWGWSELALAEIAGRIGARPEPHRAEADRITDGPGRRAVRRRAPRQRLSTPAISGPVVGCRSDRGRAASAGARRPAGATSSTRWWPR